MEDTVLAKLAGNDAAFKGAPIQGQSNAVPDGDYTAVIRRFDFIDTKNGLKLLTEADVATGPYSGCELSTWHDLEDSEKFKYLKGHLLALGLEIPDSLTVLDAALKPALDRPIAVTVKTKDGFKNVYVNRSLGDAVIAPADETPWPDESTNTAEEEIPF